MGHSSPTPKGLLFVLVGPGGAGKNALINELLQRNPHLSQLATATTRAMRDNEEQGREHDFVSVERFREMIDNNELLEHQEVTPNRYYGIPRATVENHLTNGQNLLADIEVLGAQILRAEYPDNVILIFITVPGGTIEAQLKILEKRMNVRNASLTTEDALLQIQRRLERAKTLEFPFAEECDTIIVNDDMGVAVQELETYILDKITDSYQALEQEEV